MADFNDSTATRLRTVGRRVVSMVADSVSAVLQPAHVQVQPPTAFNGNVQVDHISGVATVQNADARRMLILLDIERPMTGFARVLFETRQHGGTV